MDWVWWLGKVVVYLLLLGIGLGMIQHMVTVVIRFALEGLESLVYRVLEDYFQRKKEIIAEYERVVTGGSSNIM